MPPVDYFARRVPVAVVFGSFFLVLLPLLLLLLRLYPNFLVLTSYLAFFEATVLGTGHFFITLALYLQSSHLDYFVEAFLWRFRDPWVARTLGPLYFARATDAQSFVPALGKSGQADRWSGGRGLLAAVAAFGLVALAWGSLGIIHSPGR